MERVMETRTPARVEGYDASAFAWRGIHADGTPDEDMLERMTRAIVDAVDPEQIILFGSAARGQMGAKSDLDVLVVKNGDNHRSIAWRVHTCLPDDTRAVDVVVATSDDMERHRGKPYYVIEPALREGRILYDKGTTLQAPSETRKRMTSASRPPNQPPQRQRDPTARMDPETGLEDMNPEPPARRKQQQPRTAIRGQERQRAEPCSEST